MKTITSRQFAAVKRVAQNVNFAITKRDRIMSEISKLREELETLDMEIQGHETGIKAITGRTSEELVMKVVENTGKVDKEGRPVKITRYEPREEIIRFNEKTKLYEIMEEEDFPSTDEIESEFAVSDEMSL